MKQMRKTEKEKEKNKEKSEKAGGTISAQWPKPA
jgi:hypothetical protein